MRGRTFATRMILVMAPVSGFLLAPLAHALPPASGPQPIQACPKAAVAPSPLLGGPQQRRCM